jgi:hypothetical protein
MSDIKEYIRENYRRLGPRRIAENLGVTKNSVIGHAYRMGLSNTILKTSERISLPLDMVYDTSKPHGERIMKRTRD